MPKFRKKPVVIEAKQWWLPNDVLQVKDYVTSQGGKVKHDMLCEYCRQKYILHGWIETMEGGHIVCPGDWIITGVNNEMYPCKNEIFLKTYEMVETNEPVGQDKKVTKKK